MSNISKATQSTEEFGLAVTSKFNKQNDSTVVPIWGLDTSAPTEAAMPEVNDIINMPYIRAGGESVIGVDTRTLVPKEDFGPNGKYRAIVKLFLQFENAPNPGSWAIATGWLIRGDLLVTAGHCAFDWGYRQGRLKKVKAYVGYDGRENINDPNVQFRKGRRVATTSEWLKGANHREGDIALIQVETAFENVKPITYSDTPTAGLMPLGIVGYPGDLRDAKTGEAGAHMYQSYETTQWSLSSNEWKMLEYSIDTFGGNSGSPVFRQNDMKSIGVHTYGGAINSATVLGEFGNTLNPYINAFNCPPSELTPDGLEEFSLQKISAKTTGPTGPTGPFPWHKQEETGQPDDPSKLPVKPPTGSNDQLNPPGTEGWWNIIKKVSQIVSVIAETGEADPGIRFGEFGHVIAPLASVAMQTGTQPGSTPIIPTAMIQRAVLGEAALSVLEDMSTQSQEKLGIPDKMSKIIAAHRPFINQTWRLNGNRVYTPIIRHLLNAAAMPQTYKKTLSDPRVKSELAALASQDPPKSGPTESVWPEADPGYTELLGGLVEAAGADGQETGAEFWGLLARYVVGPAVKAAGGWLVKKVAGESGPGDGETAVPAIEALENLPLRALAGEAAVQVLATIPKSELESEGLFSKMWSVFKGVLPQVIHLGADIITATSKKSEYHTLPYCDMNGRTPGTKNLPNGDLKKSTKAPYEPYEPDEPYPLPAPIPSVPNGPKPKPPYEPYPLPGPTQPPPSGPDIMWPESRLVAA